MHDPMTVAFEIRYPWKAYKNPRSKWEEGYRSPFITIWHVDPERDGSDDSCGWSRPRLSKDQVARCKSLAGDEAREPWYQAFRGKQIDSPTEAETLVRQAFMIVGRVLSKKHICNPPIKPVTFGEASTWACDLLCSPVDNIRNSLSFLPGWSSNRKEDRIEDREYCANQFFHCIASYILRERRSWYHHPRWHFWHWKFQIHPLEAFKRWAFSRCCKCGKRFTWGYSPCTNSWNSKGPSWFRGEKDVYHSDCDNPANANLAGSAAMASK